MKRRTYQLWLANAVSLYCLVTTSLSQAQITPDGSLGNEEASRTKEATINGIPSDVIEGGAARGKNLFHSFSEFNIKKDRGAYFANPSAIENIFTRITGGNPSNISDIQGTLGVLGNANLFLLNPNGIVFGPNARLDVKGSFVASTANSVVFNNGLDSFEFSATNPQAVSQLLQINVPTGLQFGEKVGRIINQSQTTRSFVVPRRGEVKVPVGLEVQSGKTIALVGGDVLVKGGSLTAPEGRIELGSVAGSSLVSLNSIAEGWLLEYRGVQDFRDIELSQGSVVSTNAPSAFANSGAFVNTSGSGSGSTQLYGRRITISDNASVVGYNFGVKPGGNLEINASKLVQVSKFSVLNTVTFGTAKAGDIIIKTPQLLVQDGGDIRASTEGSGQAGNIVVYASESVEVLGRQSRINTQTFAINESAGKAGTLQIETGKLILREGGQISNSTFGAGDGGTLIVKASEAVEVSGGDGSLPSGLLAQSTGQRNRNKATGNAGTLTIDTRQLIVRDGARISVGAVMGSTGQGGQLRITATDFVEVSGTGINRGGQTVPSILLAESQGSGNAGNLSIKTGELIIQDGAEVSVNSLGSGNAGNLDITARSISLDNGKLTAVSTSGAGGNINLKDLDLLLLRRNSQISTTAGKNQNGGDGGNITIDADLIVAFPFENSDITANAFEGSGGNVDITAQGIFGIGFQPDLTNPQANSFNDITASSELGTQGTVAINQPDVTPQTNLVNLPENPVDVAGLVAQNVCVGNADQGSEFTITGRGGLPDSPNTALSTDDTWEDWRFSVSNKPAVGAQQVFPLQISASKPIQQQQTIVEAQGWVRDAQGNIVLTAESDTTVPHAPGLTARNCN